MEARVKPHGNTIKHIWMSDWRSKHNRKTLAVFGDSFTMANNAIIGGTHFYNDIEENYDDYSVTDEWRHLHQGKVIAFDDLNTNFEDYTANWMTYSAMRMDYDFQTHGLGGSNTYYAYYSMLEYLRLTKKPPEVVILLVNSTNRIYHPDVPNLCTGSVDNALHEINSGMWNRGDKGKKIFESASSYYKHLHDHEHEIIRKLHFCYYLDNHIVPKYPDTKFIIISGFPEHPINDYCDPTQYTYNYDYKNCMEIRPPMIHLVGLDGGLDEHNLINNEADHRPNHLTVNASRWFGDFMAEQMLSWAPEPRHFEITRKELQEYQQLTDAEKHQQNQ